MHLALYALSARSEPELFAAILRIAPWSLLGASLILAAGFVDDAGKVAALDRSPRRRILSGRSSATWAGGGWRRRTSSSAMG